MDDIAQLFSQLAVPVQTTIAITLATILTALIVSIGLGAALTSALPLVSWPARIVVEIVRGTSALIILFWIFFALPFVGIRMDAMSAAIFGLGLNAGAYGAEIVRGALTSVPKGQVEASIALNFDPTRRFWIVLLPQASLQMIPQFGNLFIEILKLSSLVSLITITDLTNRAYQLNVISLQTFLIFSVVLGIYFSIAVCLTAFTRSMEAALRRAWA